MGGFSKKSAKGRLDKYYHMAKEHGYRSRAAFKLIQLNKKYGFLTNSKVCVDLCAAPGGWLQVAAKYMPMASIKIGVDLDVIKPIKGCVTFQCDITTPKCIALIKKELKHFQCDVVLNDGAPNVGTDWNLDAYMQIELSLHAVKLATQVLKKGGTFVTKVFRSKDYNSFLYILNSLFNKVESSKPPSSRSQSAEIFMVCIGYKAPDFIDPKFLDPKYAFEDVDKAKGGLDGNEQDTNNQVNSLKMLLKVKRPNRMGYNVESQVLNQVCDFSDFLESADPFEFLTKFSRMTLDRKAEDYMLAHKVKKPIDLDIILDDIKVAGKGELSKLLTLRHKYQAALKRLNTPAPKEEKELDPEAQIEKDLEEAISRIEKEKKRAAKKEREEKKKHDLRQKMSVIATQTGIENDQELYLAPHMWDKLREEGIENMSDANSDDDSYDSGEESAPESQGSLVDEMDLDPKRIEIEMMAAHMDNQQEKQEEYAGKRDRNLAGKQIKAKALLESQRQLRDDLSSDDAMVNRDLMEVESDDDLNNSDSDDGLNDEDEKLLSDSDDELIAKAKAANANAGKDVESSGSSDSEDDKNAFVNPLSLAAKKGKGKKVEGEVSEGEWSDEAGEANKRDKGGKDVKKAKLGKRANKDRDEKDGDAKEFFSKSTFEEVAADQPDEALNNDEASLDSTEIAETRILAKKMLRKKQRSELLDSTYNRYSFHEPNCDMPNWFVTDESKHYFRHYNCSKEEILVEKQEIKDFNTRPSKKVEEAKNRKKKRLVKAMQKVKAKATVIADQDMNEQTKMRQIQKMYAKEKSKHVEEKKYVVNRSFNSVQGKKSSRGTKMVDARLRADTHKGKQKKGKFHKGGGAKGKGKGGKANKK